MPRDSTTAIYTRVNNSFSNPVVGTTIDPTDADSFFDDVESSMNSFIGTSTTSLAIGTGSKTFTTQTGKSFLPGLFIQAFDEAAPTTNYMYGTVTSYNSGTGSLVIDVSVTGGSGTFIDWLIVQAGARGATGATGATGDVAGFKYSFNTATSGDPGSGKFLFNNATFGSATSMNISETDGDGNGLSALLATLDDGTSTNKCLVVFTKTTAVALFIGYITGTITDNGSYDTFSLTPILTTGSISNADTFRAQFFRVGDKGADGTIAGSTGATANALLRASGTGGATLQNSQVVVDNSGNMSGTNTIELGNTTDTTLSRGAAGVLAVEGVNVTPNVPITSKSAAYTTVLGDANTAIYHPSSDNNARTFTIDSNANVAYPVGTLLTFINEINTVTIAITSDTLTQAGSGSTGSRTLAANGMATAIKVASTKWVISGSGLT